MKVFRLNDCDWYAGNTLEDAIKAGMSLTGLDRDDLVDEDAGELSDEQMKLLIFTKEDGSDLTFEERLSEMVAQGETFPCFFASTEY